MRVIVGLLFSVLLAGSAVSQTAAAPPVGQAKLAFATWCQPGVEEIDAVMLVESIRRFAGADATGPVRVYVAAANWPGLKQSTGLRLQKLGAELIQFDTEEKILQFPYAPKVQAAALAEQWAAEGQRILVWMDPDTIFLQEPKLFHLPPGKAIGYRPVFLPGIGSPADQPPTPFWDMVLQDCRTPPERVFPVTTVKDGKSVRGYFNAGLLVIRPEKKLLRHWWSEFYRLYRSPAYLPYYQDNRYSIFVHQVILSAVLMAGLEPAEWLLFPDTVSYSLYFHPQLPEAARRSSLGGLVTARHEFFFDRPEWRNSLLGAGPLQTWIIGLREELTK